MLLRTNDPRYKNEAKAEAGVVVGHLSAIAKDIGGVGNWDYWAGLHHLTPREFACLWAGLLPESYDKAKSLNTPSPAALVTSIDDMERMATREQEAGQLPEKVTPAQWKTWANGKGYAVSEKFAQAVERHVQAAPAVKIAPETYAKKSNGRPLPQQRFQEQEILRVIGELSYDPKNLPKSERGKDGVKAEVPMSFTRSTNFPCKKPGNGFARASAWTVTRCLPPSALMLPTCNASRLMNTLLLMRRR